LREAIAETQAELLVSTAHLLDMAKADKDTKSRWCAAVCSLGSVRFAASAGIGEPIDRERLASLMVEAEPSVATMTTALELHHDARLTGWEANQVAPPKASPKRVRELVVAILDGEILPQVDPEHAASIAASLEQLRPVVGLMASLGVDRETILASLDRDLDRAIEQGSLDEVVRIQRGRDGRRKPRPSDHTDETHLAFARYADVATVDANVYHSLRPAFGQPIPSDGRGRTHLVFFKPGDFERLAFALRKLHSSEATDGESG
jgi:hypothetical protein